MGSHTNHFESASDERSFATTRWSVVASAGRTASPDAARALAVLCETYWYPLYAHVRRRVPNVHDARDLTQAFFAELLEKNYVGAAAPERGKFRAFLLTAFNHFLSKEWDKVRAQKRGGGRPPISLDFSSADANYQIDPAGGLSADEIYEQQWVVALLKRTLDRLEEEHERAAKSRQFQELKGFLIGDEYERTYAQVAGNLQMTEAAARKAVSRMRNRYRELLREEILQTVSGPEEAEEELRSLFMAVKK